MPIPLRARLLAAALTAVLALPAALLVAQPSDPQGTASAPDRLTVIEREIAATRAALERLRAGSGTPESIAELEAVLDALELAARAWRDADRSTDEAPEPPRPGSPDSLRLQTMVDELLSAWIQAVRAGDVDRSDEIRQLIERLTGHPIQRLLELEPDARPALSPPPPLPRTTQYTDAQVQHMRDQLEDAAAEGDWRRVAQLSEMLAEGTFRTTPERASPPVGPTRQVGSVAALVGGMVLVAPAEGHPIKVGDILVVRGEDGRAVAFLDVIEVDERHALCRVRDRRGDIPDGSDVYSTPPRHSVLQPTQPAPEPHLLDGLLRELDGLHDELRGLPDDADPTRRAELVARLQGLERLLARQDHPRGPGRPGPHGHPGHPGHPGQPRPPVEPQDVRVVGIESLDDGRYRVTITTQDGSTSQVVDSYAEAMRVADGDGIQAPAPQPDQPPTATGPVPFRIPGVQAQLDETRRRAMLAQLSAELHQLRERLFEAQARWEQANANGDTAGMEEALVRITRLDNEIAALGARLGELTRTGNTGTEDDE